MGHKQGAAARGWRGAEEWSERQAEGGMRGTKGVQGKCVLLGTQTDVAGAKDLGLGASRG